MSKRHHDDAEAQLMRRAPVTDDLPLFAAPAARATDPATSHDAARSMADGPAEAQAHAILRALLTYGDATADALDARIGWRDTTAGRRLKELDRAGYAYPLQGTAVTRSGRKAHLWRLTPAGRLAATLDVGQFVLYRRKAA